MPEGTVEVELIKAQALHDVETFGKSDPYAILAIGNLKQRSKTIHNGGSKPVWNESFIFEIPDGPRELDIFIYDEERRGADEAMGSAKIPLEKLFGLKQLQQESYKVQRPNGKFEGEIHIGLKFFPKVHHGVLDVHLLEAHGLLDHDTLGGTSDPYAVLICNKEILKSKVIKNNANPIWNEHFEFHIDSDVTELLIKLFDKDRFSSDDPLGNVVVPLHKVFAECQVPPLTYKVLGPKGQPQGELAVALTFSPEA